MLVTLAFCPKQYCIYFRKLKKLYPNCLLLLVVESLHSQKASDNVVSSYYIVVEQIS